MIQSGSGDFNGLNEFNAQITQRSFQGLRRLETFHGVLRPWNGFTGNDLPGVAFANPTKIYDLRCALQVFRGQELTREDLDTHIKNASGEH